MNSHPDRHNLNRRSPLAILLVGCACLLFFLHGVAPATGELSHGYAAYYTSARLLLDGEDPARFYENRWFRDQTVRIGFVDTPDIFNVNPPTTAVLFVPLVWLSPVDADIVWSVLNVALLALAVGVLLRAISAAGLMFGGAWLPPLLVAFTLTFNPVYENFRFGQAYILVFLLLSLALLAYMRGADRELGIWLGLMFVVKSSGALLWLIPVLDRRFRTLAWGTGAVAVSILAAIPLLGIRVWWDYLQWLPSVVNRSWTGVTAYQTTASFVHHMTRVEPRYTPDPLLDAGWLAAPLSMVVEVVLVGSAIAFGWLLARQAPRGHLRLARFGMVSALAVPLQPVGEEHNFILLLPAVFAAIALVWVAPPGGARGGVMLLAMAIGAAMLAFPLPLTADTLQPGWRALFAYPKLYGALLTALALAMWIVLPPDAWAARLRQHFATARRIRRARAPWSPQSPSSS